MWQWTLSVRNNDTSECAAVGRRRFLALRARFIKMSHVNGKRLGNDFQFSIYLSLRMSHIAAEVVDIPAQAWLLIWMAFLAQWVVLHAADYKQIRAFIMLVRSCAYGRGVARIAAPRVCAALRRRCTRRRAPRRRASRPGSR